MKLFQYLAIAGLCVASSQANAMAVESISAEVLGSTSVRVAWSASAEADYYEIYQDSARIETGISTVSLDITGLQPATSYQFFVTACTSDGICSAASSQANVSTLAGSGSADVCDAATDGSAPTVTLSPNGDGTAELSWCEVEGADGYNVFLNNLYDDTYGSQTFSATVPYNGTEQYQVAYFANGNYPPKSAVAEAPNDGDGIDPGPVTDLEILKMLDSNISDSDVEIYFTRHAEKMTQQAEQEDGSFIEVCGKSNCAEVLNAKGELRAQLLKDLFKVAGITDRLTHAFSSHKIRTRQTIEMITADAGLTGDMDKNANDGIQEFPVLNATGTANATELDPEGTTASEAPAIEALLALPAGSVALVAGHSGTLYDIMAGIGLADVCLKDTVETCNQNRYPIDEDVKVKNFGDIWKVVLQDGVAEFVYRANFQPSVLALDEMAR